MEEDYKNVKKMFPLYKPCEDWKHIVDDTKPELMVGGMGGFIQRVCKICGYQWRADGCGLYETIMPDGRTPVKKK